MKKWKMLSLDFKAAFLQSNVDREVVVIPPHDLVKYENGEQGSVEFKEVNVWVGGCIKRILAEAGQVPVECRLPEIDL